MKYTLFAIIAVCILLGGYLLFQYFQPNNNEVQFSDNDNFINETLKNNHTDKKLDLSNQNLERIPEYVFDQKNLEELDVSKNKLTGAIQGEIRNLQNLKTLDASDNLMTGVPAEIGQLQNLQTLDLSNNQLTGLPYELGNLQNLKTLNISGNNYSELDLNIIIEKLPSEVNIIK